MNTKCTRKRGYFCILLIAVMCVSMLGGCGKKQKEEFEGDKATVVFQYGNHIVTLGETYIYAKTVLFQTARLQHWKSEHATWIAWKRYGRINPNRIRTVF